MNKLVLITSAIFFSLLIFGPAFAGGNNNGNGDHGNNNGPKSGGNSASNSTATSGAAASSKAESRASAASTSGARSSAKGGNASASGGNAAGGAGGNATANGGEGGSGGQVIVSTGGSGSGGLTGRMVPDVSASSPMTSTSCRNGITAGGSGNGWGGLLGFFSEDDLCEWRLLEQNYRASGDHNKADAIRLGMTLQRCEKLAPKEREMFGEVCPKAQAQESQNVAFQSN